MLLDDWPPYLILYLIGVFTALFKSCLAYWEETDAGEDPDAAKGRLLINVLLSLVWPVLSLIVVVGLGIFIVNKLDQALKRRS